MTSTRCNQADPRRAEIGFACALPYHEARSVFVPIRVVHGTFRYSELDLSMTIVSIVVKFAAYTHSFTDICILFETSPMLLLLFDLKHSRTALTIMCYLPSKYTFSYDGTNYQSINDQAASKGLSLTAALIGSKKLIGQSCISIEMVVTHVIVMQFARNDHIQHDYYSYMAVEPFY